MNRVDDVIFFKPLNMEEIGSIVQLMVEELQKRLADRHILVDLTPEAIKYIVEEGFDPIYGARPLRRFIQRHVETLIARSLIGGEILDGAEIVIDSDGKDLKLNWKNLDT
ncbi:MAG: hypothetical protein SCM11_20975 [Bacillota bacterium]|nr:hypothetical protein [Bacillota bacterium]